MLADGTFDRHLADLRIEHRRRRDAMFGPRAPPGEGPSAVDRSRRRPVLVVPARRRLRASSVEAQALSDSLAFVRGEAFYVDQAGERELRICFSSVPASVPMTSRSG